MNDRQPIVIIRTAIETSKGKSATIDPIAHNAIIIARKSFKQGASGAVSGEWHIVHVEIVKGLLKVKYAGSAKGIGFALLSMLFMPVAVQSLAVCV